MPIVPDDKDWTWVLTRPCDECGFDASTFPREKVAGRIRENAEAWRALLADAPAAPDRARLAQRPADDRWSALEYACHVRDVYRLYDYRLGLMLDEDDPRFPNWDQDVTAVEDRYHEQDPALVADDLVAAATALADHFDQVDGTAWERPGRRSDGARFTIDTFSRYLVHDPVHHLHDVEVGLAQLG